MSVFFIASYDIEDPQLHENYVLAADPLLKKHGGELLVADDGAKAIEGQGGQVNVVVKFITEAAALNFYNDPDYEAVKQMRLDSTKNGIVVLTKQFNPASW
ncbi:MAG: hypothetical protein AMJ53_14275 [Gammaproteobacteria bacterium SG8_11]|nr:MAG: hypothetical protein AMJ53_14275 [Gammaproteobacteria bacterium SG8_11]